MSAIKWIKITTDIFDDEKIKLIDTMPDRDALIVIWFKLLALAGKQNESGLIFLSNKMPYTDEMLATIFNRPINTLRLALKTFQNFDMIEINENQVISISNWEKHQNIDGMDKIKEQNRIRQAEYRKKQKLMLENKSNITSRDSNAVDKNRIELEKEKDIELEKEKDINNTSSKDDEKGFEEFWNLYDKKVGKVKCKSYWDKHIKSKVINKDNIDDILEKVMLYVNNTEKKYRKDPERYIRDRKWEDEIITANKNKTVEDKKTRYDNIV